MKRYMLGLFLLLLFLSGCSEETDPHPEWDAGIHRVGSQLGAVAPEGFTLSESNDALAVYGIYYFTWTAGEGQAMTNAKDEEATIYDAQLDLLVQECENSEAARKNADDWLNREKETYTTGEEKTESLGGQEFQLLPLEQGQEGNPYDFGCAGSGTTKPTGGRPTNAP